MTLTPRQADLLHFLRGCAAMGKVPTLQEMGFAIGERSPGNVSRLVDAICAKGFAVRSPKRPGSARFTVRCLSDAEALGVPVPEGWGWRAGYRAALAKVEGARA